MSGFSISMWPGSPIPVPAVYVPASVTVMDRAGKSGGPILLHTERDKNGERLFSEVPDELYLREVRDLDVGDPDAMAAFIQKYGRIGLWRWKEVPEPYTTELYEWSAVIDIESRRDDFRDWLGGCLGDALETQCVPLAEAALYVQLVRDLTRVWEYTTGLITFSQVIEQWESDLWYRVTMKAAEILEGRGEDLSSYERVLAAEHPIPGDLPEEVLVKHPEEPEDLYRFMDEFLGAALRAFHVRPLIYAADAHGGTRTATKMISRSSPLVSLYGALCLQLANHMAENAEYRTCQKCGRLFYRQQGRARFGQHHTKGERLPQYCSWSCSHAAAQAQYKKRKIEASEQARKRTSTQ